MGTSLEMKLHGLQGHPSNHSFPSIVVEQFESFVDKVSFPNRLRADYSGAQYYFRSDVIRVSMCDIEKEHCTYVIEMRTGEKPCLTRKKRSLTGLFNEEQLEILLEEKYRKLHRISSHRDSFSEALQTVASENQQIQANTRFVVF